MTTDQPIAARVVPLADGRGLARCGQCGQALAYVIDYAHPTWVVARGYTAGDDGVRRATNHHREQRHRVERHVTKGIATVEEQTRLREGRFSRRGDPTVGRGWDPTAEKEFIDPPDEPGFVRSDSDRLPQTMECPRCTQLILVTGDLR